MVDGIKAFDYKDVVKKCELPFLGAINVICGKNSSGKTTLVEAISNAGNFDLGLTFDDNKISEFFNACPIDSEEYKNLLLETLKEKPIWYWRERGPQITSYQKKLLERFEQSALSQGLTNYLDKFYRDNRCSPEVFSSILLPAKRDLVTSIQLSIQEDLLPSGSGVLKKIFSLENQPEGTEDKNHFDYIFEAFKEITSGYEFDFRLVENQEINLLLSEPGKKKEWVDANSCGLGFSELLIILYFSLSKNYDLVIIEEPENHIHPEMQRKLLSTLKKQENVQYLFTTHSSVILDSTLVDKIFLTEFDKEIKIVDATSRAIVLSNIGYSVNDNLTSDLIILVEGPYDKPVIEEHLYKMGLLDKYHVKIWPMGGDIMDKIDLSVFLENYKTFALVDNDPGSAKVRKKFIKNCKKLNIPVVQLKSYAIENYFPLRVLFEIFGSQMPEGIIEIKPDEKLKKQIGIDVKKNNRKLARLMTLEELKKTGDYYKFLTKVKKELNKTK